jgi:hypothetical protein
MFRKASDDLGEFREPSPQRNLSPSASCPVRQSVLGMHQHDMLGYGRKILEPEPVDDQIAWVKRHTHPSLGKRIDQLSEETQRLCPGFERQHRTDVMRVFPKVRKDPSKDFARRRIGSRVDVASTVDDHVGPKVKSQLHRAFGTLDPTIQLFGRFITSVGREPNRAYLEIQIIEQLPQLPQRGSRNIHWTDLVAGIDFNHLRLQPRGRLERLSQRKPQTC